MTTRHTPEGCLITTVAFVAAATDAARSAGVAGINQEHHHALQSRLVADEVSQLSEGPIGVPCSLRVPNRCALADVRQFFQRNPACAAFGFRNESLADDVVGVALEAALSTTQLPQSPFGAACADRLQRRPASGVPPAALFHILPAVALAVAIGCEVDDAKVDAKHIINLIGRRLIHSARDQ